MRRLSPVALSRASLRCQAQASHCCGLSCSRAQTLGSRASAVVTHRLSSCGSQAPELGLSRVVSGLSCSLVCGIFLDQGSNLYPLPRQCILIHCATREVPGVQLVNNLSLASGVQQNDSVIHIHVSILFFKFFSHLDCYIIV